MSLVERGEVGWGGADKNGIRQTVSSQFQNLSYLIKLCKADEEQKRGEGDVPILHEYHAQEQLLRSRRLFPTRLQSMPEERDPLVRFLGFQDLRCPESGCHDQ